MPQTKQTAPDALRTDRLSAVQYAMLDLIDSFQKQEQTLAEPPHRDEPLHWERVHLASSARIAKDMAVKRGCDPELAAIACSLHDIGRVVTGKQSGHAPAGEQPARELLQKLELFTEEEIRLISKAVAHHSDKDLIGPPLEEIVKDADVVDCYEYGLELPRPAQKQRYLRYLRETFGDSSEHPAQGQTAAASHDAAQIQAAAAEGAIEHPVQSVAASRFSADTALRGLSRCLTLLKLLGADDAKVIDPKQVVTEPWVSFKCRYGCSYYGKSLCCPPHTPSAAETREILDCYSTAILFYRKEAGSISVMAHKAMRQLFLDGYYKAAAFGSGHCTLCEECALTHCRFPNEATPSMEACGIDVLATAKNCGYDACSTSHGEEFFHFFGLVLVE